MTLLTETNLKSLFVLILSLALLLALAGGRKMGYRFFHQRSPFLLRVPNEAAHGNHSTTKVILPEKVEKRIYKL